MRIPMISLVAAGALALGGCAYGGLGFGVGAGDPYYGGYGSYGGYGYGSPYYGAGYGYGSPYGYANSYYGGYGYGSPYYGWYNNSYYPGTGYYVYDSHRNRRQWTDAERAYWQNRITTARARRNATTVSNRENWSGFRNRQSTGTTTRATTTTTTTSERPRFGSRRRNRD